MIVKSFSSKIAKTFFNHLVNGVILNYELSGSVYLARLTFDREGGRSWRGMGENVSFNNDQFGWLYRGDERRRRKKESTIINLVWRFSWEPFNKTLLHAHQWFPIWKSQRHSMKIFNPDIETEESFESMF